MIGDLTLEKLLYKYGIDGKKLIKNNPNVLEYGEYDEIERILKYLVEELQIESRNIESLNGLIIPISVCIPLKISCILP